MNKYLISFFILIFSVSGLFATESDAKNSEEPTFEKLAEWKFKSVSKFKDEFIKEMDRDLATYYTVLSEKPNDQKTLKDAEALIKKINTNVVSTAEKEVEKAKENKTEVATEYYNILAQIQKRFMMLNKILQENNVINKSTKSGYSFTLPKDYVSQFEASKNSALDTNYKAGVIASASQLFADKIKGMQNFKYVLFWDENYKNTKELLEKLTEDAKVYVFMMIDNDKIYDKTKRQELYDKLHKDGHDFLFFIDEKNIDELKAKKNLDVNFSLNKFESYVEMANTLGIKDIVRIENVKFKFTAPKEKIVSKNKINEFRCNQNLVSEYDYIRLSKTKKDYEKALDAYNKKAKAEDKTVEKFLYDYEQANKNNRIKYLEMQDFAQNYANCNFSENFAGEITEKSKESNLDVSFDFAFYDKLTDKKPAKKSKNIKYNFNDVVSWSDLSTDADKLNKLAPAAMQKLYYSKKYQAEAPTKTEEELIAVSQEKFQQVVSEELNKMTNKFLGLEKK